MGGPARQPHASNWRPAAHARPTRLPVGPEFLLVRALPPRTAETSAKTLLRYLRSACPLLSELPRLDGLRAADLDIEGNTLILKRRTELAEPWGICAYLKVPLLRLSGSHVRIDLAVPR